MTKHLENAFDLPHLDDLLKEEGVYPPNESDTAAMLAGMEKAQTALTDPHDGGHGKAMDELYDETIDHARKLTDLGYNMDPARAPRVFEVATQLYKAAMDAANSKRDATLKAKQLQLNFMKFELEKQRQTGEGGGEIVEAKGIVTEDRNELIKRLRDQAKGDK